MKSLAMRNIILFFVFSVLILCPYRSHAIEDAIIAVVNDELITLKDLKDYIQSTYVSLVAEGYSDAQIQATMRDMEMNGTQKLIEDKLILSQANLVGIKVREAIVDERIKEMEARYGSSQNLVDALIQSGATVTDLRNKIRDQMKIKFIIDHEVRSKIYVNPQEVTDYYEQNKSQFKNKERINLQSIFIAYGNDKKAALAESVEVFKQAHSNKNFKELIDAHSDTPSVGIIARGQLLPEVEKAVFDLRLDEISPLVEVDNGIYIFKLIGKIDAKISGLDEVKETIKDQLFKEKFRIQFLAWLDELKKDAYIEIK